MGGGGVKFVFPEQGKYYHDIYTDESSKLFNAMPYNQ